MALGDRKQPSSNSNSFIRDKEESQSESIASQIHLLQQRNHGAGLNLP